MNQWWVMMKSHLQAQDHFHWGQDRTGRVPHTFQNPCFVPPTFLYMHFECLYMGNVKAHLVKSIQQTVQLATITVIQKENQNPDDPSLDIFIIKILAVFLSKLLPRRLYWLIPNSYPEFKQDSSQDKYWSIGSYALYSKQEQ